MLQLLKTNKAKQSQAKQANNVNTDNVKISKIKIRRNINPMPKAHSSTYKHIMHGSHRVTTHAWHTLKYTSRPNTNEITHGMKNTN